MQARRCSRRQGLDVEGGGLIVRRLHDRGRGRYDQQVAASPDPVHVSVAMHHDDPMRQGIELPNEPLSVDQRGADTLGQGVAGCGYSTMW